MPRRAHHLDNPTVLKLLDAAEAVFEERGFAGARIDEIAARARMAKSHVYYHFAGKQQILDDLVALRVGQILADKEALFAGLGAQAAEALKPETLPALVRQMVAVLLVPRTAFIRLALLESLGSRPDGPAGAGAGAPLLLRLVRPFLEDTCRRFSALGYRFDRGQVLSDLFHFGIVPVAVHLALGPRWAAAAGVTPRKAEELFLARLVQLQKWNLAQLPTPKPRRTKRPLKEDGP